MVTVTVMEAMVMEALLVLDHTKEAALRRDLGTHALRIVQEASSRVVVVEGAAEGVHAFTQCGDVHAVAVPLGSTPPSSPLAGTAADVGTGAGGMAALNLTSGEALFIRAWLRRQTAASRPAGRIGDGASWAAPGFQAP